MTNTKQKYTKNKPLVIDIFKRNWFSIFLFVSIFFLYLISPIDTDLGWHLRYGKHIFENLSVYKTNQIGFYLADYNWAHGYSLYQLLAYLLYHLSGLWGLAIINGLIVGLIYFFTIRRVKTLHFKLLAIVFLYLGFFAVTSLGFRSQLFTILGISVLLHKLTENKFSLSNILTIPPMFILWANLHGGFVLGLALLLIFTLGKLLTGKRNEAYFSGLVFLLSAFAGILNPFGTGLYLEAYRHSWYPLDKLIAEWVPPGNQAILLILITISIITMAMAYQVIKGKFLAKKHNIFLGITWMSFTLLSFTARRHLPLFAISSVFFLENLINHNQSPSKESKLKIFSLIIFTGLIGLRLTNLPDLKGGWQPLCQTERTSFPCNGEKYLQSNPDICKNLFNTYEWGGHISWHLPDRKTFIDGRMPTWPTPEGKSPYTIWLEIIQARKGFEKELERYGADCIFISKGTFLDLELKSKTKYPWKNIYEDDMSVIWQKNQ